MNRTGAVQLDAPVIQAITERLKQNSIDVLMLDPFVSCHRVSENDNMAIDAVIKALGRIAEEANCAIDIDHDTRKPSPGQEGLTISDTRGGSAIVNGVRSGRIFNQMTAAEADKAGVATEDRKSYFRYDKTKANMAPAEFAVWHKLVPVTVANGEEVAVAEPWSFPDIFEGVTTAHMLAVRAKAQDNDYRVDIRAKDWIGYAVIDALGLSRSRKTRPGPRTSCAHGSKRAFSPRSSEKTLSHEKHSSLLFQEIGMNSCASCSANLRTLAQSYALRAAVQVLRKLGPPLRDQLEQLERPSLFISSAQVRRLTRAHLCGVRS